LSDADSFDESVEDPVEDPVVVRAATTPSADAPDDAHGLRQLTSSASQRPSESAGYA